MADVQPKMDNVVTETSPGKRKLEEPVIASPAKKVLKSIEKEDAEQLPKELVVGNGVQEKVEAEDVDKKDDIKADAANGDKDEATSTSEPANGDAEEVEKPQDVTDGASVAVEEEDEAADDGSTAEEEEDEGSAKPLASQEVKGDERIVSATEPEPEVTA